MAAAAPPARPVPTTMTSKRRRLWGATSFMSNLCWVPLLLDGPVGDLGVERDDASGADLLAASSRLGRRARSRLLADDPMRSSGSASTTPDDDGDREAARCRARSTAAKPWAKRAAPLVEAGVVDAEALEQRPGAVEEVDAEGEVGDDVDDRHRRPLEAGDQVVVRVAPHEVGVGRAPGEVGEVEDDVEADDDARSSASCGWRSWRRRSRGRRRSRRAGPGGSSG